MMRFFILIIFILFILSITACSTDNSTPVVHQSEIIQEIPVVEKTDEPELVYEEDIETSDAGDANFAEEIGFAEKENLGFTLEYSGFLIYMDQNMNDVLTALGEPLGIFEAPSCAFDGIDRIFSYPGIQIHTYPVGDEDFVHTISIRDDSVLIKSDNYFSSTSHFHLGSSWDTVRSIFGSDYHQDFDMFTFTRGNTTLAFLVEEDIVTAITYGLTVIPQ